MGGFFIFDVAAGGSFKIAFLASRTQSLEQIVTCACSKPLGYQSLLDHSYAEIEMRSQAVSFECVTLPETHLQVLMQAMNEMLCTHHYYGMSHLQLEDLRALASK